MGSVWILDEHCRGYAPKNFQRSDFCLLNAAVSWIGMSCNKQTMTESIKTYGSYGFIFIDTFLPFPKHQYQAVLCAILFSKSPMKF